MQTDKVQADDGFFFGMGLFETMALRDGRPVLEELHIQRLANGLRDLHIQNQRYLKEQLRSASGQLWGAGSLEDWLQRSIDHYLKTAPDDRNLSDSGNVSEKQSLILEDGVLKVTVTEKNIRFDTRANPYTEQQFREGLRLRFSPVLRNETSPFTYYKTLNCGDNILVHRQTRKMGYDEAVFVNTKGEICEGSVSNVFFTRENLVVTPPVKCGLLKGTVREYLLHSKEGKSSLIGGSEGEDGCRESGTHSSLEQCREGADIEFREQVVRTEDLSSFRGMFITNALMGIMPVRSLGHHQFPDRHIAEVLRGRYLHAALIK
ncbi:MAG: aminotransferase class IV [Eubacterium sp.]|nr:aminotransferase class IV [Eubacterium sp.]